jgi:hypothetical protein
MGLGMVVDMGFRGSSRLPWDLGGCQVAQGRTGVVVGAGGEEVHKVGGKAEAAGS